MKSLKEIVSFSNNIEYVFIATSGADCIPVIDTVKTIKLISGSQILIKEWLCDYTAINLSQNKNCTLLVWDDKSDSGFELTGKVSAMQTLAFLEGHKNGAEDTKTLPQVLWRIVIDIERTNPFSHAPKEKVRIITKDDESINERMDQK